MIYVCVHGQTHLHTSVTLVNAALLKEILLLACANVGLLELHESARVHAIESDIRVSRNPPLEHAPVLQAPAHQKGIVKREAHAGNRACVPSSQTSLGPGDDARIPEQAHDTIRVGGRQNVAAERAAARGGLNARAHHALNRPADGAGEGLPVDIAHIIEGPRNLLRGHRPKHDVLLVSTRHEQRRVQCPVQTHH